MALKDLSAEEQALLSSLGLKSQEDVNALFKPTRGKNEPPPLIDLTKASGSVKRICLTCGNTVIEYVDYVKRSDTTGYAVKTVQIPTHEVTREHIYHTFSCPKCKDEELSNLDRNELVQLVINLRNHVRRMQ